MLVSFQGSNRIDPVFTDLDVFLLLPLSVEPVFPEWALDGVGLVIASAIGTFECVRARIAFFGFETRWVRLLVRFAAPPKFSVVFRFVRSVALDAFRPLDSTRESCVSPLPAIFALGTNRTRYGYTNNKYTNNKLHVTCDFHVTEQTASYMLCVLLLTLTDNGCL